MPAIDPLRVTDGNSTMELGMNSGLPPSLILPSQYAFGQNVTIKDGFPETRPGFRHRVLATAKFANEEQATWFKTKNVQEAIVYTPPGATPVVAASIGGRVFAVRVGEDYSVQEITITGDRNPEVRSLSWMIQAEELLLLQDGQSKCFIYDGSQSRRSAINELPVARQMAYGNGRIWLALGREFVAADIYGSQVNAPGRGILNFTENDYLSEGGAFTIPFASSGITGLQFTSNLDSSLGDGELAVHCPEGITLVNVPADRTVWKDLRYPIQRIGALGFGSTSQSSIVNVNSDQWYRAPDGMRSFIMARRDFATWGNTPQTREMQRVIDADADVLLKFSSSVIFDNRLIWCANPVVNSYGWYHRALGVLEFSPVSSMHRKSPPSFAGVWTGVKPIKVFKGDFDGNDRCFMFVWSGTENQLWEITRDEPADTENNTTRRIESAIETRSYAMGDPTQFKRLETGDIFVDRVMGEVDFSALYRSDQYPCWIDWHSWSECATVEDCGPMTGCRTIRNTKPQFRPRMRLPQPADDYDDASSKYYRDGYEFQTRIEWTGHARCRTVLLHGLRRDMEPYGDFRPEAACKTTDCCNPSPYTY